MVNTVLPLLRKLVVAIAISAAVTAISPRASSNQPLSSSSNERNSLDSDGVQVVAASQEEDSVRSHHSLDALGEEETAALRETVSADNGNDDGKMSNKNRREEEYCTDLCGNGSHSRLCPLNSGSGTIRNLRGSRTNSHNSNHAHHQNKSVDSAAKSSKEGKIKKRFLRCVGDEQETTYEKSSGSAEKARHEAATTDAAGSAVGKHLKGREYKQ